MMCGMEKWGKIYIDSDRDGCQRYVGMAIVAVGGRCWEGYRQQRMLKTFLKILYGSPKMYHKDKGEITESTGGGWSVENKVRKGDIENGGWILKGRSRR